MLALPLQDRPSDSPAREPISPAGDNPPPRSAPGRPASADGRELLAETHRPTPPPSSVGVIDGVSRASAPKLLVGRT
jgi:hypothetical protein